MRFPKMPRNFSIFREKRLRKFFRQRDKEAFPEHLIDTKSQHLPQTFFHGRHRFTYDCIESSATLRTGSLPDTYCLTASRKVTS